MEGAGPADWSSKIAGLGDAVPLLAVKIVVVAWQIVSQVRVQVCRKDLEHSRPESLSPDGFGLLFSNSCNEQSSPRRTCSTDLHLGYEESIWPHIAKQAS